jgi:hypothetical protein
MKELGAPFEHRRRSCHGASILLLATALVGLDFASSAGAQIVPATDEFEISRPDGDEASQPAVAADRRGGWGVTWAVRNSSNQSGAPGRIRLVDRDGEFVSGSLRDLPLDAPDIGLDGAGNGVAVGILPRPELGGFEVDAQCFDSTGRPRGDSVRVDSGNISPDTRVPRAARVDVESDGSFVVVWQEDPQVEAPSSIFFRRFDADCFALGNVQALGAVGDIGRHDPRLARRPDGGFVVVWLEGSAPSPPRVVTQAFDAQGVAVAPAFAEPHGNRLASSPNVVVAPSGEFAVAWRSDAESSSSGIGNAVFARVFSVGGTPLGDTLSLRSPRELQVGAVELAAVAQGFLAVWSEGGVSQATSAIYGRTFDAASPNSGELAVRPEASEPLPRDLKLAALTDAEFVLVWTRPRGNSAGFGIVARRYVLLQPVPGCVESPTALCLDGGRFRVTVEWRDFLGRRGLGHTRSLTGDSGLFWFFHDSNLEVLVKMVDACAAFHRRWFYGAATTNTEYSLRVTDTVTSRSRSYFNRLGESSPAITDSDAFAACP